MKSLIAICSIIALLTCSCGGPKYSKSDAVYDYTNEVPVFPGGPKKMKAYIAENVRYPEGALKNNTEGKVYVEFVVEKNGRLTQVEIVRGVSPEIDKEAIRVISEMPDWDPAVHNNEVVRCRARIPINFVLTE